MKTSDDILAINEHSLDRDWIEQPRLYNTYARKLADAKEAVRTAEAAYSLAKAEIANDVRQRFETYGLEKCTVDAVADCVTSHDTVQQALADLNAAKHRVDVIAAMVEALDHRKKALENLVELHGRNYFSEPRARNGAMDETVKKAIRRKGQQ